MGGSGNRQGWAGGKYGDFLFAHISYRKKIAPIFEKIMGYSGGDHHRGLGQRPSASACSLPGQRSAGGGGDHERGLRLQGGYSDSSVYGKLAVRIAHLF